MFERLPFLRPRPRAARLHPGDTVPTVERPLAVIGDIHGMAALLERMLAALAQAAPEALPIFVGDLIDRGPASAAVLHRVQALDAAGAARCLLGNHEEMLLGFLDDPVAEGPRWLRHGGRETLASFGLAVDGTPDDAALGQLARDLRAALGPLEGWLRARPLLLQSGTVVITHAGCDPARPIRDQRREDLLWGPPGAGGQRRDDGMWIVQGHTVMRRATLARGRIMIDTGAHAHGRLTAVLLGGETAAPRFLTLS
ncbi:metallophosphoesterase [Frigidibacter sp. MR17.24]|uniref:metallophosphoesterase n=1 Tax=Frigidibacter sp. MR17.24 TaxID=3127345 RepID=UPI003012EB48